MGIDNDKVIYINLFGLKEVACLLSSRDLKKEQIKVLCENELLNVYKTKEEALDDILLIEIVGNAIPPSLYFHTKKVIKPIYTGFEGYRFRFKECNNIDIILECAGYINPVKSTCKELGVTQKELAEQMGISETTLTNWARGATPIPDWGLKMFLLLKKAYKLEIITSLIKSEV